MHPFAPTIKVSQNIRYATFTRLCTNTIPVPAFCKGEKENRHLRSRNHQTGLGRHGSRKTRLQTFQPDRSETARSFPLHVFISSMPLFAGPKKNRKASPTRRARERWRIKEDGRVGEPGGDERGREDGQGGGRVPGGLGEAYLERTRSAQRAAAARGRGAAAPGGGGGRKAHGRTAPAPVQPWRGAPAPWPRVGSPAPRHPGLPAWVRSGPGRRRPLQRRLGASHRRAARPARRGRAGPDPRTGAAARRPRRSAPSRASQPLPGNAQPRAGRRAPPPGRPGACLRAARRRARRDPVPALPQDPPLRRAPGTAPPRTHTRTPGALEERSQTRRFWSTLLPSHPRGAGSRCVCGAAKVLGRPGAAERTKPREVCSLPQTPRAGKAGEEARRAQPIFCLSRQSSATL